LYIVGLLTRTVLFLCHPVRFLALVARSRRSVVKTDFRDANVSIVVDSFFEWQVRCRSEKEEPELVEWIKSFEPGSVFYDIGANVGTYSIFADRLQRNHSVYSFEPNAFSLAKLVENVALNGCSNVRVVPAAAYNEAKFSILHIPSQTRGKATCQFDDMTYKAPGEHNIEHGMFGFPVDKLIAEFGFPAPDYVKIDIDGLELLVLQGMATLLASDALRSIFVEINNKMEQPITDLLQQYRYELSDRIPRKRNPGSCNCIFERRK